MSNILAILKAPLTAMILVTEMVGDIRNLMPLDGDPSCLYCYGSVQRAPVYEAIEKNVTWKQQLMIENFIPLKFQHTK